MHKLRQQGMTVMQLASHFQVHRNTITDHLAMRVAYSPDTIAIIGCSPELGRSGEADYITIYEAGPMMPLQPSPSKVHQLARNGHLQTTTVKHRLYTRVDWVRDCVQRFFPPGLYYTPESLRSYCSSPDVVMYAARHKVQWCGLDSKKRKPYYPAHIIGGIVTASDASLTVPAIEMSIALKRLQTIGVAVVSFALRR